MSRLLSELRHEVIVANAPIAAVISFLPASTAF
jgi:hypothetical protein